MSLGFSDHTVRLAAFNWLREQVLVHGEVLPRHILAQGFLFEGHRVPLLGPQGIFKPGIMPSYPLSITTVPDGPYRDGFTEDGFILYRYRGTDPNHRENVGLREAHRNRIPLVHFHGVVKGKYLAIWPVFVIGDDPRQLAFTVAVEDEAFLEEWRRDRGAALVAGEEDGRRAYVTASVLRRLHQHGFRERVLRAYREQCALCRLRHEELLDAAHIVPDRDPEGEPKVTNGLALCKLHHAAFDRQFIGIRPDYVIEVRRDILVEDDGPMLQHGLKGMNNQRILLPYQRQQYPDRALLERRYELFRAAG